MFRTERHRRPVSPDLAPLRSGSHAADHGALTSIDSGDADSIRRTDKLAAQRLLRYVTPHALLHNEELWCLWLEDLTEREVMQSDVVATRVRRVAQHRRTNTPPWVFEEIRQPRGPFYAVPKTFPRYDHLPIALFEPGTIANDQVWVLDDSAVVTAGIMMSRVYRVWIEAASGERGGSSLWLSAEAVHNAFPCPELSRRQRQAIEDATHDVMLARAGASMRSLDELYSRPKLPRALKECHDVLDGVVDRVFGVRKSMKDDEIAQRLISLYRDAVSS